MIASVLIRINILKRFLNYKFKISSLFSIFILNIQQKQQIRQVYQFYSDDLHYTQYYINAAIAMTKTHTQIPNDRLQ